MGKRNCKNKAFSLAGILVMAILFSSCGKGNVPKTETPGNVSVTSSETKDDSSATVSMSKPNPTKEPVYTVELASLCLDEQSRLKYFTLNFNELNPEHAVKVRATGKSKEELSASKVSILAQLAEGKGPDILVLNRADLKDFYEKEKLAPLTEAVSPTIAGELVPAVVELGTINGEFVGMAPCIDEVMSVAVSSKLKPIKPLTVAGVLDKMNEHPDILRTFVTTSGGRGDSIIGWNAIVSPYGLDLTDSGFVDLNTGKADFYCEDFVLLLERMIKDGKIANDYWGLAKEGDYLGVYINDRDSAGLMKSLLNLGEDYEIVGLPTRNGFGSRCSASMFIAVNKASSDREDVREFMKYVLANTGKQGGLSVRIDAAATCLRYNEIQGSKAYGELCWIRDDNPGKETWNSYGDLQVDINTYVSKYEEFVTGLEPFERDSEILNILTEEIGTYLITGDNADATARIIQERVQAYLDEHR